MLEIRGELDLGQESLGADHGRELGPKHLERDLAVVPEVLGHVDRGHSASADFPVKTVSVGQRGLQPVEQLRHRWVLC